MPFPVFDAEDAVPEAFKPEYEERNGKWHVKEPEAAELRATLQQEREARQKAEKDAKAFRAEKAALEAKATAAAAGVTEEQLTKLRADIEASFQPQIDRAATLETENRALKLDHVIRERFGKAGVLASALDKVWKLHGEEFDLTSDGKPMVKASPGSDVDKHVEAIAKQYPHWRQGTKGTGGGAAGLTTTAAANGGMSFEEFQKLSPSEKLKVAREMEKA